MSWNAKKEQVTANRNALTQKSTSGMSLEELTAHRTAYQTLLMSLTTYLKEQARTYNLSGTLEETGQLQGQIRELEKEQQEVHSEVDTALARDEVLRTRNTTGNSHTLYLLDRPVRKGMVPYLWALSVLFVGVGVLLFYWLTPALLLPQGGTYTILPFLSDIFSSRYTWMALFGAASVVILFLSLKIAGVFGK